MKRVKSFSKLNKEEKEKAEMDELLSKFLFTPKYKFSDLGGLDHVI